MNKILTACLMAVLCQSAFADDDRWMLITKGFDDSVFVYIDTVRSTSPNNIWIKFLYPKKYKYNRNLYYIVTKYAVSCENAAYKSIQSTYFNSNQEPLHTEYFRNQLFVDALPDSIMEEVVNFSCLHYSRPQEPPLSSTNRY